MNIKVLAYDLDAHVVNMHRALGTRALRAEVVKRFVAELKGMLRLKRRSRADRYRTRLRNGVLKAKRASGDPALAARWNLAIRCSYLGVLRRSGSFAEARLDSLQAQRVCKALSAHRGLGAACRHMDAFAALRSTPREHLLFVDPPYLLDKPERQYKAGDFGIREHAQLAQELKGRHFVLCHRDDEAIRKLYKDWCEIVRMPRIMNINRADKSGTELVIVGRGARR
jgi:site-specific DNA-adenine methylase